MNCIQIARGFVCLEKDKMPTCYFTKENHFLKKSHHVDRCCSHCLYVMSIKKQKSHHRFSYVLVHNCLCFPPFFKVHPCPNHPILHQTDQFLLQLASHHPYHPKDQWCQFWEVLLL